MKVRELNERGKWMWLLCAILLAACVRSNTPTGLGGESHFLQRCSERCGSGLDCIQGVCTRDCVVGKDRCGDLFAEAVCIADSVEPGEVAVCDLTCSSDADCALLSADHRCEGSFCRARALAATGDGAGFPYPTDETFVCPEGVTSDPVEVRSGVVLGDELVLQVTYGGGCKEHQLAVCFGPDFAEEVPAGTSLRVIHKANDDECNRAVAQELRVNLQPLADTYQRAYRTTGGLVDTNFGRYAFGDGARVRGVLSCEERALGAAGQVASFERQIARECQTDGDCVQVDNSTACTASCGAIISTSGAQQFSQWLEVTNTTLCGAYEVDCGPVLIPPCDPPLSPACVNTRCQEGR